VRPKRELISEGMWGNGSYRTPDEERPERERTDSHTRAGEEKGLCPGGMNAGQPIAYDKIKKIRREDVDIESPKYVKQLEIG